MAELKDTETSYLSKLIKLKQKLEDENRALGKLLVLPHTSPAGKSTLSVTDNTDKPNDNHTNKKL